MKSKLTKTQKELLLKARNYTDVDNPIRYDVLKRLCGIKSFDATFNALLNKGFFRRHETNDFSNQYILVLTLIKK